MYLMLFPVYFSLHIQHMHTNIALYYTFFPPDLFYVVLNTTCVALCRSSVFLNAAVQSSIYPSHFAFILLAVAPFHHFICSLVDLCWSFLHVLLDHRMSTYAISLSIPRQLSIRQSQITSHFILLPKVDEGFCFSTIFSQAVIR